MRRIVIVGAGFGGLHAATKLAAAIENRKKWLRLTVVADRAHFLYTPLWGRVAAGSTKLSQVALPLPSLLPGHVQLYVEPAQRIDLARRLIHTTNRAIEYDYLVMAPGAEPDVRGTEQLRTLAMPCATGRDAVDIHDAVTRAFQAAARTQDPNEKRQLLTFIVAGAGELGVEVAAQLADRISRQAGHDFASSLAAEARVILAEQRTHILHNHDPQLRVPVEDHLRAANVELRLNEEVIHFDGTHVEFRSKDALGCRTLLWCGGVRAPRWLADAGFQLAEDGRIETQPTLQAVGQHGVFVIGDAASTGAPHTAEVAVQQADLVARNVIAGLSGRSQRSWEYEPAGTVISLGRNNAVVSHRGTVLLGRTAMAYAGATRARLLPRGLRGLALVPGLFAGAFGGRVSSTPPILPE